MKHTIENERLSITVEELGAELVCASLDGKERLWQNSTGEWAGHAPLLFPVCGHCGVTVDGVAYPIGAHGFAKKTPFLLTDKGADYLTFSTAANADTKKVYPYDFIFRVTYRIQGALLTVVYEVENPASSPLYFACGGHESFALDRDVDGYEIVFEKEETLVHYRHDEKGFLTGETENYGDGKPLPLPVDFLQEGATLIFKDIASRSVILAEKGGKPLAKITFADFPNLLLWRAKNAKFICIEPWSNLPDFAGAPDKEFSKKAGVFKVDGGKTKTIVRTIEYL